MPSHTGVAQSGYLDWKGDGTRPWSLDAHLSGQVDRNQESTRSEIRKKQKIWKKSPREARKVEKDECARDGVAKPRRTKKKADCRRVLGRIGDQF